jgi:hypothetical protein
VDISRDLFLLRIQHAFCTWLGLLLGEEDTKTAEEDNVQVQAHMERMVSMFFLDVYRTLQADKALVVAYILNVVVVDNNRRFPRHMEREMVEVPEALLQLERKLFSTRVYK